MKRLCLLFLLLTGVGLPAFAQRGTIQIFRPNDAKPASYVYITVRTRWMKHTRLYVDNGFHGRRDLAESRSGFNVDTTWYVRFPQITTQDGQWTIKVTGEDIDGKTVTATTKVSPTVFRDVQIKLEPKAPPFFHAPDEKLYKVKTLDPISDDPEYKVTLSPTGGTILPFTVIQFTVQAFDEEGKLVEEVPEIKVTGGRVKKTNKWTAPVNPGHYRISVRYKDAIAQVFYKVAKPLPIKIRSWGVHQLRVSGATFAQTVKRIDPNVRPTTTLLALIMPEDKDKDLTIKVEGLSNTGAVLITKEVVVEILPPK